MDKPRAETETPPKAPAKKGKAKEASAKKTNGSSDADERGLAPNSSAASSASVKAKASADPKPLKLKEEKQKADQAEIPKAEAKDPKPKEAKEPKKEEKSLKVILHPEPVDPELLPDDYCCSITSRLMREPVTTSDGQTYEREAIEEWLLHHNTSPLAGSVTLSNKILTPVLFVKNAVEKLLYKYPQLRDSREWYLPESWIRELGNACAAGNEAAIRELVARDRRLLVHTFGANSMHEGKTALQLAVLSSQPKALDVVVELLEHRARGLALVAFLQANHAGIVPLHQAILDMRNSETLLKIMSWMGEGLESIVAPENWSIPTPAFHDAVTDSSMLQILHTLNAALLESVRRGEVGKVSCLLRMRANPDALNEQGKRALYLAVEQEKVVPVVLKLLFEAGADPNAMNLSSDDAPLHCAIRKDLTSTALELKLAGARLDLRLKDGTSPLHLVAAKQSCKMADALWGKTDGPREASDASPMCGPEGYTPIHYAALHGSGAMLLWLIKRGKGKMAEVDVKGRNILHLAALRNHTQFAEELLRFMNGDKFLLETALCVSDSDGNTPLHLAAQAGATDMVVWQLDQLGALPTKNQVGLLPLQVARTMGHAALVREYADKEQALRRGEMKLMSEEGGVGALLWKQHRLIGMLHSRLEQQELEIDRLRTQIADKQPEHTSSGVFGLE